MIAICKRSLYAVVIGLFLAACDCEAPDQASSAPDQLREPKVTKIDPNELRYTTPTINSGMPATVPTSGADNGAILTHEDNWRQFEFIDPKFRPEITHELADIDRIWKEQSVPLKDGMNVFRDIHVRKRIPNPIAIPMTRDQFEILVGSTLSPMMITFYDVAVGYERLEDVYAAKVGNLIIYGLIVEDRLHTLGIQPVRPEKPIEAPSELSERFQRFSEQHGLLLVHWRSRTLFETKAVKEVFESWAK